MTEHELRTKCYEHGYNTASGKIGTGWMQVHDLNEWIESYTNKDSLYDYIFELVYEWTETLQFEYETKSLFEKLYDYLDNDNDSDYYETIGLLYSEWSMGYTRYILEKLEN